MREPVKCLDGPLEGQIIYLDRRLFQLYDEHTIDEIEGKIKTGQQYKYIMMQDGLRYIKR